ncbi:hypothetical protein LCGC14_1296800 [marine sediment metagenome]|uniref:Ribbon-helix-helix protein CopG domain-containing protein n=1 Tax=marine sediment metagenome TaxID=412755 RepID=A0A0F9NTN6_9ZZZZ
MGSTRQVLEQMSATMAFKVAPRMKASVENLAGREGRSPSDWLRRVIQRELDSEAGKRRGRKR